MKVCLNFVFSCSFVILFFGWYFLSLVIKIIRMCFVFFYDFCMKLLRGKKNDGNCISVGIILMFDCFLFDWLSKISFIGFKKNKVEYYFFYNRKLFIFIDIWDCFFY